MKYSMAKVCSDAGEFLLVELKTMRVLFRELTKDKAERLLAFLEDGRELVMPEKLTFDFESVYKKYPRKEGKSAGIAWLKRHVKTERAFGELHEAVERYQRHCQSERLERQFTPHFSTWVKSYRDWVTEMGSQTPKTVADPIDGIGF